MKKADYQKLLNKYENLPNNKKVAVLSEAILVMQSYNGRSVDDCIVIAMGGEYADED